MPPGPAEHLGFPALREPPRQEVDAARQKAADVFAQLSEVERDLLRAQDALKSSRSRLDILLTKVIGYLKADLMGVERPLARRIMRSYGVKFVADPQPDQPQPPEQTEVAGEEVASGFSGGP